MARPLFGLAVADDSAVDGPVPVGIDDKLNFVAATAEQRQDHNVVIIAPVSQSADSAQELPTVLGVAVDDLHEHLSSENFQLSILSHCFYLSGTLCLLWPIRFLIGPRWMYVVNFERFGVVVPRTEPNP